MPPKILIIRFSSIGDIVLTSPVVRCVAKQLKAEVHYLTKNKFKNILTHNPYISKLYGIDKNVSEVMEQLKSENYNFIIDLHKNLRTQEVKLKLGLKSYTFNKLNIQKWLKVNFKIDRLPKVHIVDRYFEGLAALKVNNDGYGLDYFISDSDKEEAAAIVGKIKSYNVLVLGANYFTKRIPQSIAEKIISKSNFPIIILGGKDPQFGRKDFIGGFSRNCTKI